jgi:hypothetical protein
MGIEEIDSNVLSCISNDSHHHHPASSSDWEALAIIYDFFGI